MKIVHCKPSAGPGCNGPIRLLDGTVYRLGRAPDTRGREPFRIKCAVCKLVTELTVEDYARIPEATMEDLEAHGLDWMVKNDLRGAGATEEQLEELKTSKGREGLHVRARKLGAALRATVRS